VPQGAGWYSLRAAACTSLASQCRRPKGGGIGQSRTEQLKALISGRADLRGKSKCHAPGEKS